MEKLYEKDAYLTRFSAVVKSCAPCKAGWEIILDRTAFYPMGGGQPCDTGTLGDTQVQDVQDRNGIVVHICDAPLEVGTSVTGQINWGRRFDLMQNHSGEHIVSGIAHSLWSCDNVGFHMGTDTITIDLNTILDDVQLRDLEERVNRYIWEDHPVQVSYPSPSELEVLDYRSKKALTGQVRIVTFPGADVCACCGTHVSTTGQIGLVKLLSVQKFREGVRIELVCGSRALRHLNGAFDQNHQVSRLLSAKMMETAPAVKRILEEYESLKLRVLNLENQHFSALADQWAGAGDVLLFEDGLSPDALRRLCDMVSETCGGRCACFSGTDETGYKYAIAQHGGDLCPLGKAMNQSLQGRGGGQPGFLQGAVNACRKDILGFFDSQS